MREVIVERLMQRLQAYAEFAATLADAELQARLEVAKDKSIAEHLWCVVGARESYARALTAGQWESFACSMTSYEAGSFVAALDSSARALLTAIEQVPEWTPAHDRLLAQVAEHEVMHEGQLIRHVYGMGGSLPASWTWA